MRKLHLCFYAIIVLSIALILPLFLANPALADCAPEGTANADTITCDTSTDSGDGNGNNALDADGVRGDENSDNITVESGATTFEVIGDKYSTGGTADDTITVEAGGVVIGEISGDSSSGDNNSGNDSINNAGTVHTIVGDSVNGDNNSGDDIITNSGTVDTIIGDSQSGNNNSGNDTITNSGTVEYIYGDSECGCGTSGEDTITNSGTVNEDVSGNGGNDKITNTQTGLIKDSIDGRDGDDTIENHGTVNDDIEGDADNDTITNTGTVGDDVAGDAGNDKITNSGTIGDDLEGNEGDDTIENSGTVHGDILAGDGDDLVMLTGTQVDGIIDGGPDTDTLDFSMRTTNEAQYNAARAQIAVSGDGSFSWGSGTIRWQNFETLLDNLVLIFMDTFSNPTNDVSCQAITNTLFADVNMKVGQNSECKTLYFFGANGSTDHLITTLDESQFNSASANQVVVTIVDDVLGALLYVEALGNGQFSVQYYSTADGSLLSNTVISL